MMYKFNNNDIVTGYIKELLHSFNLPQCHVLIPESTVFPDTDYIYKNRVYRFTGADKTTLSSDLSVLPSAFKAVRNYSYGQSILNFTKNLDISGPLYDAHTHEYLGEYLRFHRDYVGIDLMSMYNCFSNNMPKSLKIDVGDFSFDSASSTHKIYAIPVKFNRDYTIGIDCDAGIEMVCGFYDEGAIKYVQDEKTFYNATYLRKTGARFKKPFLFSKLAELSAISAKMYSEEKNLVLFLKVPFSCESSITILEGDYSTNCEHYFDEGIEKLSNIPLLYSHDDIDMTDYSYVTRLQLFGINSNVSYPFADRLVEYLFNNVVDSSDDIGDNIKRVQNILLKKHSLSGVDNYGEWDDSIRKALYANEISLGIIHKTFDSIGYYDRDIEEALGE